MTPKKHEKAEHLKQHKLSHTQLHSLLVQGVPLYDTHTDTRHHTRHNNH